MPISATFVADFTSFSAAVEKATVKLRGFETDVAKVDKTLSKFGNEFSGTKVIQDALAMEKAIAEIGGVAKLTGDELKRAGDQAATAVDKMKKMGIDVPPQLQKLADAVVPIEKNLTLTEKAAGLAKSTFGQMFTAFSAASLVDKAVSSLVEFGKAAIENAGHISDLADKTGLSIKAIQQMSEVAKLTGSDLDTFTASATKLGINIAGGTTAAKDAIHDLGLSFDNLRRLKPEDQFNAVIAALANVKTEGERNRIGVALLGRSFMDMSASVVQGYADMAKNAKTASDEQIKAIDKLGDEWVKFKDDLATTLLSAFGSISKFVDDSLAAADRMGNRTRAFFGAAPLTASPSWDFPGKGTKPPGPPAALGETPEERKTREADEKRTREERDRAAAAETKRRQASVDQLTGMGQAKGVEQQIKDLQRAGVKPQGDQLNKFIDDLGTAASTLAAMGYDKRAAEVLKYRDALRLTSTENRALIDGLQITNHALANQTDILHPLLTNLADTPDRLKELHGLLGAGPQATATTMAAKVTTTPPSTNFLSGVKGSLDSFMEGMTGGKGMGGFMSKIGGQVTKGFGDVLSGGLNSAISAGVGLAMAGAKKIFGALTGAAGKETNRERDAFIKSTYGSEDALKKLAVQAGATDAQIKKIFSAHTVEQFRTAVGEVGGIISEFTQQKEEDAARLNSAIDKYGFAFEDLGAALQKSKLDEQSKDLIEDWRVLIEAGVGVWKVNEKMSKSVTDYITLAKKTGTEVPSAMKPMLQSMIDQGVMFDANGRKIDHLEDLGVSFADTLTQGFDRVVKKLDEMLQKLAGPGGVTDTLSKIPDEKHIDVIYDISGDVPQGDGTTIHIPPHSSPQGAKFSAQHGTGGRFIDFGSGTDAILHGKERIVTAREGQPDNNAVVAAVTALQASILRAMRENSLQVRDQLQLARA